MGEHPVAPEPRLPEIVVDVEQVRRYAGHAATTAARLRDEARALVRSSQAVPGCWRSVPSSARAGGRLDAVADLLRSQQLRCDSLIDELTHYAAAAAAAQRAVATANHAIDEFNRQLATTPPLPPCRPVQLIDRARTATHDLAVADRRCTSALHVFSSGEGRGAPAVSHRLHDADTAVGADPLTLASAIRAAARAHPPDLIALEEQLRALGRMSVRDPRGTARVVDVLGPLLGQLPTIGNGTPGWDRIAFLGVVAAARRAHRRVTGSDSRAADRGGSDGSSGSGGSGVRSPARSGPTAGSTSTPPPRSGALTAAAPGPVTMSPAAPPMASMSPGHPDPRPPVVRQRARR